MLGGGRCGQAEDTFRKAGNTICDLVDFGIAQAPGVFGDAARVEAADGVSRHRSFDELTVAA